MKTYFSVTYDEYQATGSGSKFCIANKLESIRGVKSRCELHAYSAKKNFDTTMHHYQVTEWDEDDSIIKQTNLEEALYENSYTN